MRRQIGHENDTPPRARSAITRARSAITAALVAVVLVAIGLIAVAPAAGADCIGPTLQTEAETVDRGGTIHVIGTGWGDDCHDTDHPPGTTTGFGGRWNLG